MNLQTVLSCCLLAGSSWAAVIPDPPDIEEKFYYPVARAEGKCMDDLGCFPITSEFFHPLYRPLNLNPADKEKINTKFLLYTKASPKSEKFLKAKNTKMLTDSKFDSKKKTKIIIHGWLDNQWLADWMRSMKDEYLLNGDHNVILVDWSGGNTLPYTQATANTRVVGAEVAFLLNWLKDTVGLKLADCHILGHSLGAHVAGYAGERLKGLGRITGMDPAEPYFQNLPPSVRLDPTDADFVDVIHTDSKTILLAGLGMSQLVGHVDFFPNNGQDQPGCDISRIKTFITEGLVSGARNFVACNHHRAMDFIKDSINSKCQAVGYVCDDWKSYLAGQCADCGAKGEKCASFGEQTPDTYRAIKDDNRQQKFFVKTSNKSPFCLYHYQVTVRLQDQGDNVKGSLILNVRGSRKSEKIELTDNKSIDLNKGTTFTYLVTTNDDLGSISSAYFSWSQSILGSIFKKGSIYPDFVQIVPMNEINKETRTKESRKYCAAKKGGITSKTEMLLSSSDLC